MSKRKKRQEVEFESFFAARYDPDKTGDRGLWCRQCRKRQPWKKLVTQYELRSEDVYRVWFCPQCGAMVREDNVTDMGLAYELETNGPQD